MQRIAVVGSDHARRLAVATSLGRALDLPVFHTGSWTQRPTSRAPLDLWHSGPRWIIAGWGPWAVVERRFAAADTIVFLDVFSNRFFDPWRRARMQRYMRQPALRSRILCVQADYEMTSLLSMFAERQD